MPRRYICRECKEIYSRKSDCKVCGDETEKIEFPIDIWTVFPYIMAAAAGMFLLSAYLFSEPFLIWLTFPFIIVGILADSYYQKKIDKKVKDLIKDNK